MLQGFAGGSLFGEIWGGSRPAVLALHGWGRTHRDFVGAFADGVGVSQRSVLAVDLPGFGATPPPPAAWGSEDYAAALVDLFVAGGPIDGPVVVVGHSLGGRVGLALAHARPDVVAGLVLTGSPLAPRPGAGAGVGVGVARGYRLVRAARRIHMVSERRLEAARRKYGSADYRNAQGVMRDVLVRMVSEHYDDKLAALRVPVELVWGERDHDIPLAVAEAIAARVKAAQLTVCPDVGHLLPTEAPGPLREATARILASAAV
ncbi:MAG: alpha/beta fold hydrolase [Acidimicrobiales bacterium]